MKILVCGDRKWVDGKKIFDVLKTFSGDVTIIHGGCEGADKMAGEVAEFLGFKVIVEEADWKRYGLGAGPIRNKKMLSHKPDIVIAFHSNIEKSKGTKCMVKLAKKESFRTQIYT